MCFVREMVKKYMYISELHIGMQQFVHCLKISNMGAYENMREREQSVVFLELWAGCGKGNSFSKGNGLWGMKYITKYKYGKDGSEEIQEPFLATLEMHQLSMKNIYRVENKCIIRKTYIPCGDRNDCSRASEWRFLTW